MNSIHSDCKVNLIPHCRHISIFGERKFSDNEPALDSSIQSGLVIKCFICQDTNMHIVENHNETSENC